MDLEAKYEQHQKLTKRNYNLISKFIIENTNPKKVIKWKGTVGFRVIDSDEFDNIKDNRDHNNSIKKRYLNTLYLTYDEWHKKYFTNIVINDNYIKCTGCGLEGDLTPETERVVDFCAICGVFKEK